MVGVNVLVGGIGVNNPCPTNALPVASTKAYAPLWSVLPWLCAAFIFAGCGGALAPRSPEPASSRKAMRWWRLLRPNSGLAQMLPRLRGDGDRLSDVKACKQPNAGLGASRSSRQTSTVSWHASRKLVGFREPRSLPGGARSCSRRRMVKLDANPPTPIEWARASILLRSKRSSPQWSCSS